MSKTWIVTGSIFTAIVGGITAYKILRKRKLSSKKAVKEKIVTMEQREEMFNKSLSVFGSRLNENAQHRFAEMWGLFKSDLQHIPDQKYLNEVNDKFLELVKWSNLYFETWVGGERDDFTRAMVVQESIEFYQCLEKARSWLADSFYERVRSTGLQLLEMPVEIIYVEEGLPHTYSSQAGLVLAVAN